MNKLSALKFVGEVMSQPEEFKKMFDFVATSDDGDEMMGQFKVKGRLAEFLREAGLNVKRTVEARDEAKPQIAAEEV